MDFLVAPVRVRPRRGRPGGGAGVHPDGARRAGPERPPQPEARPRLRVPRGLRLRPRRDRAEARACQELLDGRVPNFPPPRRVAEPHPAGQTVQVNERTFETTVDGVFSGGDVVTGAATAIEAIAAGRKAAYAIDRFVATGRAEPEPVEVYSRKDAYHAVRVEDLPSRHRRRAPEHAGPPPRPSARTASRRWRPATAAKTSRWRRRAAWSAAAPPSSRAT